MISETTTTAGGEGAAEDTPVTLDDLRTRLIGAGFRIVPKLSEDECKWYAYRRSAIEARECETNDGKPAQIVVTPHVFTYGGKTYESVEVELCGEFGAWWKLTAYALSFDDVMARLSGIEASLVSAWNALDTTELATLRAANKRLATLLQMAVRQNSHDMLMTGEELRQCDAALTSNAAAAANGEME